MEKKPGTMANCKDNTINKKERQSASAADNMHKS